MPESLAGVVLAAGAGERLRPLTWLKPKVLCPIVGVALLDTNIGRLREVTGSVAVNGHYHLDQLVVHLSERHPDIHVSEERDRPLGTAGAIGRLRDWLDGRAVVVANGDAWSDVSLAPLLDGWDGDRVRVLVAAAGAGASGLGPTDPVAGTLLPWRVASGLCAEPSGLYATVWAPEAASGRLEVIGGAGRFVDCGTPASYLAANLAASGGRSVIGEGAAVEEGAEVTRSVVWPGAVVTSSEVLVDAVRAERGITVLVRRASSRPSRPARPA